MSKERARTLFEKYEGRLVFLCALLFVVLVNLDRVTQIPVWDAAMGLFPGALYLVESGFDLASLLQETGWAAGGPNNYVRSSWFWVTAVVLWISPSSESAFIVLHLVQFSMVALIAILLYRLTQPACGRLVALVVVLACLVVPIFRVQTGRMYREIPLSLCTLATVVMLSRDRAFWGALFATLALTIKTAGLVAIAVYIGAVVLKRDLDFRARATRVGLVVIYPLISLGLSFARVAEGTTAKTSESLAVMTRLKLKVWKRFELIPDVAVLISFTILLSIIFAPHLFRSLRDADTRPTSLVYPLGLGGLTVVIFSAFMISVAVSGIQFWLLPRYFTQVIPLALFVFVGSFWVFGSRVSPQIARTSACVAGLFWIGLSAANSHGELYERVNFKFSMLERDLGYQDGLVLQRMTSQSVAVLPEEIPKYVPRPMYYFTQYPGLNYVESKVKNVKFVLESDPESDGDIESYPDHFFLVLSYPYHGGEVLGQVARQADSRSDYVSRFYPINEGMFTTYVVEVIRVGGSVNEGNDGVRGE